MNCCLSEFVNRANAASIRVWRSRNAVSFDDTSAGADRNRRSQLIDMESVKPLKCRRPNRTTTGGANSIPGFHAGVRSTVWPRGQTESRAAEVTKRGPALSLLHARWTRRQRIHARPFLQVGVAGQRPDRIRGRSAGPVVVLLHGAPLTSLGFVRVIRELRSHHRVIAPDFPGFGRSTVASGFGASLADYSAFVHDFCRALDLRDFYVYLKRLSA